MQRWIIGMLVFVMLIGGLMSEQPAFAAGSWVTGSVSTSYGSRNYKMWVPQAYSANSPAPLVLMLHGCSQNPDAFAVGTSMNTLADMYGFLVVYPEQSYSDDYLQCWQWWDPTDQVRGSGEPLILTTILSQIKSSYTVDPTRTYVAGISAGGAMAVILGATYPDIFAAVGVGSGLEYQAASNRDSAWGVMSNGGPNPDTQGFKAYQAMGSRYRTMPVIIFHGTGDSLVNAVNGDQIVTQWAQTNDYADDTNNNDSINATPDMTTTGTVPGGRTYARHQYYDSHNQTIIEQWVVNGMGHAWSGGSSSGSFTDPKGPNATAEMWRFFSSYTNTQPPTTPQPTSNPTVTQAPATTTPILQPTSNPTATQAPATTTPTLQPTSNPTATPLPGQTTVSFTSIGVDDGYVAAANANGTTGGYSVGTMIAVGDNADAPFRSIVSFDTSSLPDDAVITQAELRFFTTQAAIGNPWDGLGSLVGDIHMGCFGGACTLVPSDFQANPSSSSVVTFVRNTPSGNSETLISGMVSSNALTMINRSGKTQFKLRFSNLSNNNWMSDYLILASGEYSIPAYRPVLVISYQ